MLRFYFAEENFTYPFWRSCSVISTRANQTLVHWSRNAIGFFRATCVYKQLPDANNNVFWLANILNKWNVVKVILTLTLIRQIFFLVVKTDFYLNQGLRISSESSIFLLNVIGEEMSSLFLSLFKLEHPTNTALIKISTLLFHFSKHTIKLKGKSYLLLPILER